LREIVDIKDYTLNELNDLATKIRSKILQTVSKNGGHLSSSLGAVELIIAMHYVFDVTKDPFIFDVSHQAYPHKLLTDRWEVFDTLREFNGISGYTKPSESKFDYFVAGHSSTSISIAVGAAKAIMLKNEDRIPVVLIGDGSMSAGMVYEALNELGERKYPCIIIINDNEMSISKPIGAISQYLSRLMAGQPYQKVKKWIHKVLEHLPKDATYIAKRFEESLKLITPGLLFEELGLEYIGPINGHNISTLIDVFQNAKRLQAPVIIHAQTIKGKGYDIAEGYLENWHGVSAFDIESGKPIKKSSSISATDVFGNKLLDFATQHNNIVGVTAAMPSGTGLKKCIERFPDRFWDVGIAEQHSVTSMAAMAKEGFKPFCAIYSTFLQRGFDQIVHDVALANLPVIFAIDRAGIVGEDGETHQGVFDIGFLRLLPNMIIFAPRDNETLENAIEFAYTLTNPSAFRYPRGAFINKKVYKSDGFILGKLEILEDGDSDILFIGYGNGVNKAIDVAMNIDISVGIVDLRFIKPLDIDNLKKLSNRYKKWYIFSDNSKISGVATAIKEVIEGVTIESFEYPDIFIPHGNIIDIEKYLKIDTLSIVERLKER
jgi:1-deoxy-D-xylulose-5-phosphate synthase